MHVDDSAFKHTQRANLLHPERRISETRVLPQCLVRRQMVGENLCQKSKMDDAHRRGPGIHPGKSDRRVCHGVVSEGGHGALCGVGWCGLGALAWLLCGYGRFYVEERGRYGMSHPFLSLPVLTEEKYRTTGTPRVDCAVELSSHSEQIG